ncbi:MAG: phosphoglucosamine mutase [Bacteroidetes bacterium]|nr:phosphoglucosamine mutase [Bacteroidota bacterium]
MAIIKSISGLRFTLDEIEHNPTIIKQYAKAFHLYLSDGKVIIGRDGRPSGLNITEQLIKELTSLGRELVLIDIVPTPTLQVFVETHNAAGGICITASHNPDDWNGLKFINSDGTFLDIEQNKLLWNYLNEEIDFAPNKYKGTVSINNNAINEHIDKILSLQFINENIVTIKNYLKENNIKFVIDAVNCSGGFAVPMLLDRFDAIYEKLYCDSSGVFPHNPEPLPQHLTSLSDFIKNKNNACDNYIGIAVDPDADRLVLADEDGNCVSEEKTICIAIDSFYTLNPNIKNNAVVNQSTTMLADFIAKNHNIIVNRSAVGEINVVKLMKECNAKIGGEGSGGVILSDGHYGRDSLVGIALMLCLLSKKNILLKDLIASYPQFVMSKSKYNFYGDKDILYKKIEEAHKNYTISKTDGIKIYYENAWLHIRTSNTEPIVRIIAEAENVIQLKQIIQKVEPML